MENIYSELGQGKTCRKLKRIDYPESWNFREFQIRSSSFP